MGGVVRYTMQADPFATVDRILAPHSRTCVESIDHWECTGFNSVIGSFSHYLVYRESSLRAVEIEDAEERLKTVEATIALIGARARIVPDPLNAEER